MENKEVFNFTYSAKEQAEVKKIRDKYISKEEDKMERLRRLDASVSEKATAFSLIAGIAGALIFGIGMCCCLVWEQFLIGVLVGIIGAAGVAAAYPLYQAVLKKERERIAPEILRLTDELMK